MLQRGSRNRPPRCVGAILESGLERFRAGSAHGRFVAMNQNRAFDDFWMRRHGQDQLLLGRVTVERLSSFFGPPNPFTWMATEALAQNAQFIGAQRRLEVVTDDEIFAALLQESNGGAGFATTWVVQEGVGHRARDTTT
jgi:hypothetical protein